MMGPQFMGILTTGAGRGAGGGGGITPILPDSLAGVIGWWDSSVFASMHLTGSGVDYILDQSGGSQTMNAVNDYSNYSATGFNGKPGITTNIALFSAFETASAFPMGTGNTLTAWFVGTNAGASSDSSARYLSYGDFGISDDTSVGKWCINVNGTNQNLIDVSRNSGVVTPVDVTISTGNRIVIVTIDSSGVITMYLDGVANTLQTVSGNWVSAGKLALGRKATTNTRVFISATFAEWGVSTALHTPTQCAGLYAGLKTKWGL
jgi:hypothetical protein